MGILFDSNRPCAPPSPERVALRVRVLGVVCARGYQEVAASDGIGVPVDDQGLVPIPEWIYGAQDELEQWEIDCLNARLANMSRHLIDTATWQCEGIGVLLWALGLADRPAYDHPILPLRVLGQLDAADWSSACLRDQTELRHYAENLCSWQARFRQFSRTPEHVDFVAQAKRYGMDIDHLPLAENDIAIGGRPIATQPELVVADGFLAVASERLRASKWLCGLGGATYSLVEV